MNSPLYIFKTRARDFDSYLKFFGNLENKISSLVETKYFSFSNYLKNNEKVENCGHVQLLPSPIYLQKLGDIRRRFLDLKLVKRPALFVKINISVKNVTQVLSFLVSYGLYNFKTIVTCFFYKHIQSRISGRNQHMLNIFVSLETSSPLFSCLNA